MNKQYTWNLDEHTESWECDLFDTVQECIEDFKNNYPKNSQKDFNYIYVGEVVPFIPDVIADRVIEDLTNDAYEECGDVAYDWLDCLSNEDKDELSKQLTEVTINFLKRKNEMPYFYSIKNIKKVSINTHIKNDKLTSWLKWIEK